MVVFNERNFEPVNDWKPDSNGDKWNCCPEHMGKIKFIIDASANRRSFNEDRLTVRARFNTPAISVFL